MLRVWREKLAGEATYLRLAEGLESLKLRHLIIDLLDSYSASSRTLRMQRKKEQVPVIPRLGKH